MALNEEDKRDLDRKYGKEEAHEIAESVDDSSSEHVPHGKSKRSSSSGNSNHEDACGYYAPVDVPGRDPGIVR